MSDGDTEVVRRQNARTAWILVVNGGLFFVGWMVGQAAEQEIWLNHYRGDFGANARMQGLLQSVDGIISLLLNPLIASATDTFGRRPLLILSQTAALLRCVAIAARPNVVSVAVGSLAKGFSMNVLMVTAQASLGDLYKRVPEMYGRFVSLFMMMPPFSGVISPIIGSALATRNLRLPYVMGACLSVASVFITCQLIQETCGPSDRKAFAWMRSNPLNFLRLFSNGARLRQLAFVDALGAMTNAQATQQIEMVQRTEQFGWNLMERASFQSLVFACYTFGFSLIAPTIQAVGLARTMYFGCGASVVRNAFNAVATSRLQLQANIVVLGWTRAIPYVALKTANMQAGVAAGMAQGELQGCYNNLQTVVRIIAPLLWSGLYSLGSARGQSSTFHLGVSAACLLQLVLSLYANLDANAPQVSEVERK